MLMLRHILIDVIKNRMVVMYAAFLMLLTTSVFMFTEHEAKAMVSLQNITLLVAPLMALVFSSSYLYNSRDFMALLLTQPIGRQRVFWAFVGAVAVALSMAILVGLGIPVLVFNFSPTGLLLLLLTVLLNLVFAALGAWVSVSIADKARGLGAVLIIWFFLTLVYDGLALLLLYMFQEYPLMTPIVVLTSLNPIDLSRVGLLLQMDISALMGFTGAVYKKYFNSGLGMALALILLMVWAAIPVTLARRKFLVKDF
ncbi:MAG: ABC transporter permease subunit [Bacteroidetes bacterium]|jgi:Cu-processing system permease protein|nr:ABC transporter permease subunit [Bacteroidota bacterium]